MAQHQLKTVSARPTFTGPSYQDAIRSIAVEACDGDDVERRVVHLARYFRLDPASIRAEVDEAVDMLKAA